MRVERAQKNIDCLAKTMVVLCDSREQKCGHITEYFENIGTGFTCRALKTGDYSILLPVNELEGVPQTLLFDDEIVIERKASLDELAGNFTRERKRFEAEFTRAKARGTKVYLLIENGSYKKISEHAYRSELSPKAFKNSLLSWQSKYDVSVNFCNPEESGEWIYGTLYFWLRNRLEFGVL